MEDGPVSIESPNFPRSSSTETAANFTNRVSRSQRLQSLFDRTKRPDESSGKPPPNPVTETVGAPKTTATQSTNTPVVISAGESGKARDILTAIRTLKTIEAENRPATDDEEANLRRFAASAPSHCPSFRTRSPADTRTQAGKRLAMNWNHSCRKKNTTVRSEQPSMRSIRHRK